MSHTLFNLVLEKIISDMNDEQRKMELRRKLVMFAYADDIVVMGETRGCCPNG